MAAESSFQYDIDHLTCRVHPDPSYAVDPVERLRPIHVEFKIVNYAVNQVKLSNGEILHVGNRELVTAPECIQFYIISDMFNDPKSCGEHILSNLTSPNITRFTREFVMTCIIFYVDNLVEHVPPQGSFYKIYGGLVVTQNRVTDEEFLLRGLTNEMCEGGNHDGCAICLEELSDARQSARTPCSHVFHRDCIATWIVRKQTCPMCRTPIN